MPQIICENTSLGYDNRPIVKVAINFDAEQHTITDWKIEEYGQK